MPPSGAAREAPTERACTVATVPRTQTDDVVAWELLRRALAEPDDQQRPQLFEECPRSRHRSRDRGADRARRGSYAFDAPSRSWSALFGAWQPQPSGQRP